MPIKIFQLYKHNYHPYVMVWQPTNSKKSILNLSMKMQMAMLASII